MSKITLFLVAAVALGGCASTHQERVAAVQAPSPQPNYRAPSNGRLQRNAEAPPTSHDFSMPTGMATVPCTTCFGTAFNQSTFQRY
jgi:hypothetical protein